MPVLERVVLIGFSRDALLWSIRTLFLVHLPIPNFRRKWTCHGGRLCGLELLPWWSSVTFNATRGWSLVVRLNHLLQLAHHLALSSPAAAIPSSRHTPAVLLHISIWSSPSLSRASQPFVSRPPSRPSISFSNFCRSSQCKSPAPSTAT